MRKMWPFMNKKLNLKKFSFSSWSNSWKNKRKVM